MIKYSALCCFAPKLRMNYALLAVFLYVAITELPSDLGLKSTFFVLNPQLQPWPVALPQHD